MLHAHRPAGHERVEAIPIERAGDGLVVPDPAQPARPCGRGGAQGGVEGGAVADVRWAEADRLPRRGERQQVDVMVVQPRQHGPAGGVDDDVGAGAAWRRSG